MDMGEMIRSTRKKRELSQADLGVLSKVDSAQIGRFERGQAEPKITTLRNIADALDVECSQLLDDNPRPRRMPDDIRRRLEKTLNDLHQSIEDVYELIRMIYPDE